MTEGSASLHFAVRPLVLLKYLGQLGFVLALLTLVPLLASLYFASYAVSLRYLGVIGLLLALFQLSRRLPAPRALQQNEALAIVALAFVLSPLLMSFPMTGAGLSWGDAVFEAISAVTTTGLSTLARIESMPDSFLFARAWTQWYGGLGIIVLSTALLQGHHISSRSLIEPLSDEGLATTTRTYARRTLTVYVSLTVLAIGVLLLLRMDGEVAIEHALSAISTGGFSRYNDSLAHFDSSAQIIAVVAIGLLGALPFALYFLARRQGLSAALRDPELWLLLALTALVGVGLAVLLNRNGLPWSEAFLHGSVQAISAQSTSGFASLPIGDLDNASKLLLIIGMFIGGGLGSTAGGIKLLRLLILLRLLQLLLRRTAMPRSAVTAVRLGGGTLADGEIQTALMLILLFVLVVMASWLLFVAYGYPPIDALFEVVSATGTVGLSTGITGVQLEPLLRAVLCLDMLLGRVEIVAMLVVLYPSTWLGKRAEY